jgi:hypothetical protein
MTVQHTIRSPRTLFSKETKTIMISGVKPEDACELARNLKNVFWYYGRTSIHEVNVTGDIIKEVQISGGDVWESQSDCDHFLSGFELGMTMSGVDIWKRK